MLVLCITILAQRLMREGAACIKMLLVLINDYCCRLLACTAAIDSHYERIKMCFVTLWGGKRRHILRVTIRLDETQVGTPAIYYAGLPLKT